MTTATMSKEPEVLYSDVKFTKKTKNTNGTASTPVETTYSEVNFAKNKPSTELPGGSQQELVSDGKSKVTSERVALLVLSVLLAAACIALAAACIALALNSHENVQNMGRLQNLNDELNAVVQNLTAEKNNTVPLTCPEPEVKPNISCAKCEDDWLQHGEKCYYFTTIRSSWNDSRRECMGQGGDLVKIETREEQIFLASNLTDKLNDQDYKFWIGLTDSKEEGTWLWVDNSPMNLSFWTPVQEPDDFHGDHGEYVDGEDCVRMGNRDGSPDSWSDGPCSDRHKSICDRPLRTLRLMCL